MSQPLNHWRDKTLCLEKFFPFISLALLYLFAALLFFRPIETDDVWWHLSVGRFIIDHHSVPVVDPFSFSQEKHPWIFSQWIGSSIYYLIFLIGQLPGLQIFRSFLFLSVITILLARARKKIPLSFAIPLIFISSVGLLPLGLLRPLLFNWIFIPVYLSILLQYKKDSQHKRLLWLPLLGILWFNIHLGSFLYGTFIIGIFGFAQWITVIQTRQSSSAQERQLVLKKAQYLTGTLLLFWLSFLINPNGLAGAMYPWKVFFLPEYIHLYQFSSLILEALSPVFIFSPDGIWFFILFFLALTAIRVAQRNKFLLTILFVVSLAFFLYGRRNADFFILTTICVLIECAQQFSLKQKWENFHLSKPINLCIYFVLIFLLSTNILHLINSKIFIEGKMRRFLTLTEAPSNPSKALEILRQNHIHGEVFNNDLYGGYLLWRAYPDLRPFVDGRQLSQDLYSAYLDIRRDPEHLWPQAEKIFQFKIALIHTDNPVNEKSLKYLIKNQNWQLLSLDNGAMLFVKRGEFALSDDVKQFEGSLSNARVAMDKFETALNQYPPQKKGIFSEIKEFINPDPYYIDILEQGMALYDFGFKEAALEYLYTALKTVDTDDTRKAFLFAFKKFKQN